MNDFFQQLQHDTANERDALLSIPFIQHGRRGELGLPSYLAFLTQAYHHVKHTTPLLMACGGRLAADQEWLRDAMAHYIDEELGHQEWILGDIRACGGDADAVRHGTPALATELMCAYAYHLIDRVNPVGLLGMVLVLEGTSVGLASEVADAMQASLGLPDQAFSYLRSHGTLDISHMKFYQRLVNRLHLEQERRCVLHAASRFYTLYGNIFRALPIQLDADAAATCA